MPLTYRELAEQLANLGHDRDSFNHVVQQISGGQSSYQIDPNGYIDESVVQDLLPYTPADAPVEQPQPAAPEPDTLPNPLSPPMYAPLDAPEGKMLVNGEWLDMPVILQAMQLAAEEQRVARETAEFHAMEPSPTDFTYPQQVPTVQAQPQPRAAEMPPVAAARFDVGTGHFGHFVPEPTPAPPETQPSVKFRPMRTQELAGAAGRPPDSLVYPESYQKAIGVTEALQQDPESLYQEEINRFGKPSDSGVVEAMEGMRLVDGKLVDIDDSIDKTGAWLGQYLPTFPEVAWPGGTPKGAWKREEMEKQRDTLEFLGLPTTREGLEARREEVSRKQAEIDRGKEKEDLVEEFWENVETPTEGPVQLDLSGAPDPRGYVKAGIDPFDFAGTVIENRTLATWGEAMWERFFQLFEVPVEKAIEGDLRLQRLIREDEWNSDDDFQVGGLTQFMTGEPTGEENTISAADRRGLERLWDEQDAEVLSAIDETALSAESKAELYPFITNARHSVGNLANGLWDMGVSAVGGNIPPEVWKSKSSEERKRLLEEQASEAINEVFGKGMAAFVIASLANPAAAVQVHPFELSFMMYRPMKAAARPAAENFVRGMDYILESQGAKGPKRAAAATAVKRGAAAVYRGLVDPAYHYTRGGKEFLEMTGRESKIAKSAVEEGLDTVARSISEETAAGRPPQVVDVGSIVPDVPGKGRAATLEASATKGEPLVSKADVAAALDEYRGHEAWLEGQPEGTFLSTYNYREILGPGELPSARRSKSMTGLDLEQVRAEISRLEGILPEAEVLPLGAAERTTLPEPRQRGRQMDALWGMRDRPGLESTPTGAGAEVSFRAAPAGGMRAAASKRTVSQQALEAGVLDSVAELSGSQWPHTPRRQLGYDYQTKAVPISSVSGKATRPPKRTSEKTMRDPEPTILPEEALDALRELDQVFGEDGVILRGVVSEEGLAQQVAAGIDIRLANQLAYPKGQTVVLETVLKETADAFYGGTLPRRVKKDLTETVMDTLKDASGRRRGEGGTSQVWNPIFEVEGPNGRTIKVNSTQALAARQRNSLELRSELQKEGIDYISERIGAQANAKGIQTGVMDSIIRDSDVVATTEYALGTPVDRTASRAAALKGSPAIEKHTRLKRKIEKEKAKPDKEQDTAAVEKMSDELYEMEHGSAASPGIVDDYLASMVSKYKRTGERPTTWVFGDSLETAWQRLEQSSPETMKGLWMLREHTKAANAKKVFGSGLTGDEALMSTYFGFTPPSEGAMAAFRRASAKPLSEVTQLMPDRWMSKPLYNVSELMARDAGVLPSLYATKWLERLWRDVKLGKVAGNPGSHVMALGSNMLLQSQRRGDLFIGAKAAVSLVDYMRYKHGMKTKVDPSVYAALESSGRVKGGAVKGEIDANLKRALEDPEFATKDWRGDFMTFGVGRRVYDWWDTMFKIEDGVNQYGRRIKEWDRLKEGSDYHFPISRTRTIEAQKINGKMVVNGRVLTDAQFRNMMGRAAMEPGSRFLVDFNDAPLFAVYKRNFPLLDMMMSDFSTWRMVTDTLPFLKEGIVGEIMLGSTPRGYVSDGAIRASRLAEMATANTARTMMGASLSQRVSGEDSEFVRSMLNRYGSANPVFSVSATADPRVLSVSNGTSFSVYESVERWLRLAESISYTAPSRGAYGKTVQEWVGYLKPDAVIEVPGKGKQASKRWEPLPEAEVLPLGAAERPSPSDTTTEMMMLMTDEQISRLSPARQRHVKESVAYWLDNAKTGGMGRKAVMGLAYLEGNLYLNMFSDWLFETRKEAETDIGWSVADTVLRSFAPKWLSNLGMYGLESKRESDIKKWQELVEKLDVEEKRLEAIEMPSQAESRRLTQLKDPEWRKTIQEKHLKFAAGVTSLSRGEYRPEAILGALDPSLAESPLRKLAERMLHAPAYVAAFDRYVYDEYKKKDVKDVAGMATEEFRRKETAIHGLIDRTARQFGRGLFDAVAIAKEATFAGDRAASEGSEAHDKLYAPAQKVGEIKDLFREILLQEAEAMVDRWFKAFPVRERKAKQIGEETAPDELLFSRTPEQEVPLEGWRTPPRP